MDKCALCRRPHFIWHSGTTGSNQLCQFTRVAAQSLSTRLGRLRASTTAIANAATLPASSTVQIAGQPRRLSGATQQTLTVLVPNAQVLTLQSVGVPLVSAPGAGNVIVVDHLAVEQVAADCSICTCASGNITAAYGTQAAQVAAAASIANTLLTARLEHHESRSAFAESVAPANAASTTYLNASAVGALCQHWQSERRRWFTHCQDHLSHSDWILMPAKSKRSYAGSTAPPGLMRALGAAGVQEWDQAGKGLNLPEKDWAIA